MKNEFDFDVDTYSSDTSGIYQDKQESWLISYSDIITLLLCFFMIFYSAEKAQEKNVFTDIVADLKKDYEGTGVQEMKKGLVRTFDEETVKGFELINQKEGVSVINHKNYVAIIFQDLEFFRFSSSYLTDEATRLLSEVATKLKAHESKIKINIVGHTDSSKFTKASKAWWQNNMELSIARGLRVHDLFRAQGIAQNSLYVTGLGDQTELPPEGKIGRTLEGKLFDPQDFAGFRRRITIRVEPREVAQ